MDNVSERRGEIAYGCALPTSYLLQGTTEWHEYERIGVMHYDSEDYGEHARWGLTAGQAYLDFPPSMGSVEVYSRTLDIEQPYTLYTSDYGLIRTEHSKESELILVMDAEERERVFKRLFFDGWQPEFVGEIGYIRCPNKCCKFKKKRY